MQNRQVKPDALAPAQVDIKAWVDLAVIGQVDANVPGAVKGRMFQKIQCQSFRGLLLLLEG